MRTEEEHTIVVYSGTIGTEYKPMNNIGFFTHGRRTKNALKEVKYNKIKLSDPPSNQNKNHMTPPQAQ